MNSKTVNIVIAAATIIGIGAIVFTNARTQKKILQSYNDECKEDEEDFCEEE